ECRSRPAQVARGVRRRAREISRPRFYQSKNSLLAFSGILSGRSPGEDLSESLVGVRKGAAQRSMGGGGSVRQKMTCRDEPGRLSFILSVKSAQFVFCSRP